MTYSMWPIQQKSIAQYCSYLPIIHWPQAFIRVFVGPEHQIHPILVHDFFHAKDMYERNSYTNLQWPKINVLVYKINVLVYKMVKRELWIHTRNLLWILSQLSPRRIYSLINCKLKFVIYITFNGLIVSVNFHFSFTVLFSTNSSICLKLPYFKPHLIFLRCDPYIFYFYVRQLMYIYLNAKFWKDGITRTFLLAL